MTIKWQAILLIISLLSGIVRANNSRIPDFPESHKKLSEKTSFIKMEEELKTYSNKDYIHLNTIGQSSKKHSIYAVNINLKMREDQWSLMFIGQQHGDEPAGKEALLYLIKYLSENKDLVPVDINLWIIPMVNPDGAVADQRRNGQGADLNRDHILLSQPETRAVHKLFRKVEPHIFVDCHEFGRDSQSYLEKGWREWPLIMMDCSNNPFFNKELYKAGVEWCNYLKPWMNEQDHNYTRYFVGGTPPDEEQRYSTPEIDDARNGLGSYQGLSFIIESGIRHNTLDNPDKDLGQRVDAYLDIFRKFIYDRNFRERNSEIIKRARNAKLPKFTPTNYFWGNNGVRITDFKVIDLEADQVKEIKTPNFMNDMIVKKSVKTPDGYIIPANAAQNFQQLLDRQAINHNILQAGKIFTVEPCTLSAFEDSFDPIYCRYSGRQIVKKGPIQKHNFSPGSIIINLQDDLNSRRAVLLLEPLKLYGLFQYHTFKNMVDDKGELPIYRLIEQQE